MEEKLIQQITETKAALVGAVGTLRTDLEQQLSTLVKRLDAIEVKAAKPAGNGGGSSLLTELKANADIGAMIQKGRGSVKFELAGAALSELLEGKNISSAGVGGFGTVGVMPSDRDSMIVGLPRPRLHMRDVLPSRPTSQGEVVWVKETARPTKASPVTEYTGLKPLVEPTFTTDKEPVQTIAVLMLASNQVIADYPELDGFLRSEGRARVNEEEDLQILSGSGTPPNLNGLITQAAAFDTSLLSASDGYEYPDVLLAALQQIDEGDELNGGQFVVLHPGDAWAIRRLKDTTGRYIYNQTGPLVIAGAPVVATTQITKGTFLTGSGDPRAAEIRDRQALTVELSTEDSTNFRYNLITIRFELRTALVVKRPNAYVHGSLVKSPA